MTQRAQAATVSKTYDRTTLSVAVVMLILVAASYVINAMDRQVFSVVLPPIREDFSFSLAQGGFLSTIFTLGIGLAGVPSGYLLDRYPRKVVMLIGIAIYSVFTILTALALGFLDMSLYRAITGIGESMQNAALFSAVGAYFYSRRAMALGTLNFAYGLGSFFGPLFGGVMLQSTGSWKLPFYVYGVLGLVFIGIIGFFVTRRFTEQEEPPSVTAASVDERMPERLLNRNLIIGIITAAIVGTSMYGYLGLYPSFLQEELGFTPTQAGFALSMFGLGALMGIPAGYLGDRFPQRWVIIGALVGAIVTGYVLFNLITTPLQHNVLSFLEGMFASGFLFVNVYSLMQRSVKTTIIGRASGAFITSLYVPSALAGYLFAFLVGRFDWGGAAIVQLVLIPVIGIVAMLFLDPSRINTTRSE
ncbi:MAG: MFS transporter [Actinomycetota bacterium]|nr:MFS transporter [Actinomycetota bacterium]